MSFLAEVMSNVESMEMKEINEKVPELTVQVQNLKQEVMSYIENVYQNFKHLPKRNTAVKKQVDVLKEEINDLQKIIAHSSKKELIQANEDLQQYKTELVKVDFACKVMSDLCTINESLVKFADLLSIGNFYQCMELTKKMTEVIDSVPDDECSDVLIDLDKVIKKNEEDLKTTLFAKFQENVIFFSEKNKNVLRIKNENEEMKQVLLTLHYDKLLFPLDQVKTFLWNQVFQYVVCNTVEIKISNTSDFDVLEVVKTGDERCSYKEVFANLKAVVKFLNNFFNLPLSSTLNMLEYVGGKVIKQLSELLINNCLQHTIPSSKSALKEYEIVISDTEKLHQYLVECHFIKDTDSEFVEYVKNVDNLFINKKCQEYQQQAENIMKKDLHDMTEVGIPYSLTASDNDVLQCCVSKSAKELLNLAEKILQETKDNNEGNVVRLYCTLKKILGRYSDFVPQHHKKLLQTIPQQTALFHNNCVYIASEIVKLNYKYSVNIQLDLLKECSQLQAVAKSNFRFYLEGQIKQINDIMTGAGLTNGQSLEKLEPVTEKCIRQCLRQQELLKTVWHKVLSYPVYNKTVGLIFNSLCEFLINSVINFEDISSDAAGELVKVNKLLLTRGPKLFSDANEVSLFVPLWYKMSELNFLLSSNLLNINDRWADGKGPLALQFKPKELKQLIRALFQNTDRRAALLAKIQD